MTAYFTLRNNKNQFGWRKFITYLSFEVSSSGKVMWGCAGSLKIKSLWGGTKYMVSMLTIFTNKETWILDAFYLLINICMWYLIFMQ